MNLNPQLRGMFDLNPQMREMMQNPEVLRQMFSPETMQVYSMPYAYSEFSPNKC